MSDAAKPYTSAEVRAWPALGPLTIDNFRMLATVEALERVTKEREALRHSIAPEAISRLQGLSAEVSAAEVRAEGYRLEVEAQREVIRRGVEANVALRQERDEARAELQALKDSDLCCVHGVQSCDPCLDGFSRRERAALAACAEMRAALEAWLLRPAENWAAVLGGFQNAAEATTRALSSDAGKGWVSPEAFDAALREVAGSLGTMTSEATPRSALVAAREAVIAAAKAKHGGGR